MNFFDWTPEAHSQDMNDFGQISPSIDESGAIFWDDYYSLNVCAVPILC